MNWGTLTIAVAVIYIIYYAINIGIDLFRSNKKGKSEGYEVVEIDNDDEEEPKTISSDYLEENEDRKPAPKEYKKQEALDADASAKNKDVDLGVVETQGLPVEEFLKKAKELSKGIEY